MNYCILALLNKNNVMKKKESKTKKELSYRFFTVEDDLCDFVNNNNIKVVSITDDGSSREEMDSYNYTLFYMA